MTSRLSIGELEALKRISTPTISNAIETFNLRPRNEGYMSPEVRCLFPDLGAMVGYAVTARIKADQPATDGQQASRFDYWDYVLKMPAPRIAVVQDLDQPPAIGSFWGEVNASVHRALECVGTITDGGVRDLDEVHAFGFHFFAAEVIVSHAYIHLIDFGGPVKVGGLVVNPGDLIHADKHGAIVIPHEIAREVAGAAAMIEATERRIINYCQSSDFSVERLKALVRELTPTK
ncbi:MAG: RraA family protein [Pyrinomonadaceae bacterium]|nr:RraA family protein [Pyrinomonadaceae bacterium]